MYLGFYIKNVLYSYFIDVVIFKNFNLDSICNILYCIFIFLFIKGYRFLFMFIFFLEFLFICVFVVWIFFGFCWLVRMFLVGFDLVNLNFFLFSFVVRNRWYAVYIFNRIYNFSFRNVLVWYYLKLTFDYVSFFLLL